MRSKCGAETVDLFDTFAGSLPDRFFFLGLIFLRHFFRICAFSTFWPTGLSSCFDSFRKPESTYFLGSTYFSGTIAFLVVRVHKKNVEKICRKICRTKKTQKIWSGNALQKALPGGAKKSFKNGPGRRPKRDVFQSLLQGMPGAFQAPCGPEHHEQLDARTRTNDNDNDNDNGPSLKAFALK